MSRTDTENNRIKGGFTLMEVIIVLAIVAVLSMVAIPGFAHIRELLKATEMEAGARQLYIAAQNRLTIMKSAGTLRSVNPLYDASLIDEDSLDWITTEHMPSDYDNSDSTWSEEELCFAVNKNTDGSASPGKLVTDILVPSGAVDPALIQGFYTIEYNPSNGSVYGVFYSDEAFLYSAVRDTDRSREQLRTIEGQPVVGYYGGIGLNTPGVEEADLSDSAFVLENDEKLLIRISPLATKTYTLTVEDRDDPSAFSSYTYTFNGNQSEFSTYPNISKEAATGDIIILLDSLQTDKHFSDFFEASIDKPAITPGRDIRLTLSVEDFNAAATKLPSQSSKTVNSLFASRTEDEAFLSSARHLQNLEPTISGVSGIVGASVQRAIDWDTSDTTLFIPISNSELVGFEGGGNAISNLAVTTNGNYSGLFGVFGGSEEEPATISSVKLTDATINGGNADYVGMLAGSISYTAISNTSTFVLYPAVASNGRLSANAARAAGGLVGTSSNNSYSSCFAAPSEIAVNLTGDSATSGAGGFAGISISDSIQHCYANATELTVRTSGSYAYTGGFAGRSSSTISYSYASGNINQSGGSAAAGFSYAFAGNTSNCYAATTFNGTSGLSSYSYGFSNRAGTNCSYFSGSSPSYTSAISGITARDISGLQSVYTGTNWRLPTTASTRHYSSELSGQAYPISLVPTLLHYGNWPLVTLSNLIEIGDTGIFRPDVEIPAGQVMVFKDEEYVFLTGENIISGPIIADNILADGSLYVPEGTGILDIRGSRTVDWTVSGDIILEVDIDSGSANNLSVNILSQNGDIIMDDISITGSRNKYPYIVNVTAESGNIQASETVIDTKSDSRGVISFEAQDDINLSGAQLTSAGDYGIRVVSSSGSIDAQEAFMRSTGGGPNAGITLEADEGINLDRAQIMAQVDIAISSTQSILARSATISNTSWGKNITITSSESGVDLSSMSAPEPKTSVSSSSGNVLITSQKDIAIVSASISASTGWGMKLQFEATGEDSTLWVNGATVRGREIAAYNLTMVGTLSSGAITLFP